MDHKPAHHGLDNKRMFTACAVLSSVIGIIFLAITLAQQPPLPHQVSARFTSNQGAFILFATLSLVWSIISIPTIVALEAIVRNNKNRSLCNSAALLTSSGILLNGIISFVYVGALISIWSSSGMQGANSDYQMSIWTNLYYFMSDPALMLWGFGQLAFGFLLLSDPAFPKWVGLITLIGGLAGVLTLAVYQTPILAILQAITFVVLTSYVSMFLMRRKNADSITV